MDSISLRLQISFNLAERLRDFVESLKFIYISSLFLVLIFVTFVLLECRYNKISLFFFVRKWPILYDPKEAPFVLSLIGGTILFSLIYTISDIGIIFEYKPPINNVSFLISIFSSFLNVGSIIINGMRITITIDTIETTIVLFLFLLMIHSCISIKITAIVKGRNINPKIKSVQLNITQITPPTIVIIPEIIKVLFILLNPRIPFLLFNSFCGILSP